MQMKDEGVKGVNKRASVIAGEQGVRMSRRKMRGVMGWSVLKQAETLVNEVCVEQELTNIAETTLPL